MLCAWWPPDAGFGWSRPHDPSHSGAPRVWSLEGLVGPLIKATGLWVVGTGDGPLDVKHRLQHAPAVRTHVAFTNIIQF